MCGPEQEKPVLMAPSLHEDHWEPTTRHQRADSAPLGSPASGAPREAGADGGTQMDSEWDRDEGRPFSDGQGACGPGSGIRNPYPGFWCSSNANEERHRHPVIISWTLLTLQHHASSTGIWYLLSTYCVPGSVPDTVGIRCRADRPGTSSPFDKGQTPGEEVPLRHRASHALSC